MEKMHCASCWIKAQMLRWCIVIFAQGVQKRIVKNQICFTGLSRWLFYANPLI